MGFTDLKPRYRRIVRLVASGLRNEDVAERVGLTINVTKNYMREIYDLTGMSNRVELALWYLAHTIGPSKPAKLDGRTGWRNASRSQRDAELESSNMHRVELPGPVDLPVQHLSVACNARHIHADQQKPDHRYYVRGL